MKEGGKRDQHGSPDMSLVGTIGEVLYPESDGQPMGETDLHRRWMIRVYDLLAHRYRGQRVYVACNLLVYYEQGEPSRFVVPDVFLVLHCEPGDRRVFKIWEENRTPNVVIEITSLSTRNEDTSYKPDLYARIGVQEFFLYDPTSEYMSTPLQGFRLVQGKHRRIEPDESGALESEQLNISLRLQNGQLVMHDPQTGQVIQTAREAAEEQAAQSEARADAAEEEVRRLREQLKRQQRQ